MIDGMKLFVWIRVVVGLILFFLPITDEPQEEEYDMFRDDWLEEEDPYLASEPEDLMVEEETVIAIRGIDYSGRRSGMPCELPWDRALDVEKQPESLPEIVDWIPYADVPEETEAYGGYIQENDQAVPVPATAAEEENMEEAVYEPETGEEETPEGDVQGYEEGASDPADAEEARVDDDEPEGDESYSEGEQGTAARVCQIYSVIDESGVARTLAPELQEYANT